MRSCDYDFECSPGIPPEADEEAKHSVPVSVMGNYHEVLKKKEILREVDEDDERKARMPLFGNPFVRPDKVILSLSLLSLFLSLCVW
jgi:hypothetical protein